MSFDMAGSLTSTPTHSGIATSGSFPPTAQSTPLSVSCKPHGSLLTTPNLGNETEASAHSTPKMAKFSPTGPSAQNRNNGEAPRTPTPFKRALAEVYRGREPLSNTPQTPTKRVEDLTEIIKKDMLDELTDMSYSQGDVSGEQQVKEIKSIKCELFPTSCYFRHCRTVATAAQTSGQTTRDLKRMITAIRRTQVLTKK